MGTDFEDGYSFGDGYSLGDGDDSGNGFEPELPTQSAQGLDDDDDFGTLFETTGTANQEMPSHEGGYVNNGGSEYVAGVQDNQREPRQASGNAVQRHQDRAPVQSRNSNALPNPNERVVAPERRNRPQRGSSLTPEQREHARQLRQQQNSGARGNQQRRNPQPQGGTGNGTGQIVNPQQVNRRPQQGANPNNREGSSNGDANQNRANNQPTQDNTGGKKKKSPIKKILIAVLGVAVIGGGGFIAYSNFVPKAVEQDYDTSGRKVYDNLEGVLHAYEPVAVDDFIGAEVGDSYLAQEWSYANTNYVRENFIKFVCNNTTFSYPQVEQLSTKGSVVTDKSGNPVMIESFMNNGESLIVTLPDYSAIAEKIPDDADLIDDMSIQANIKDTDYDYQDECFDLLLNYVMSLEEIPMTSKECNVPIAGGKVTSDAELDTLMFASEDFHEMCDALDKLLTKFTGTATEKYMDKEEVHNPEYDEWYKIFKQRYDADGGIFNKHTSLWEPWYVYDENNILQYDENGNRLVRYYSVKDENGKDWIQPSKTIWKDVEKEHEVPVEYIPEKAVPYCFLGAWYAQNEYDGTVPSAVRVGTGAIDNPAGIGTPIITQVLGKDGNYHDVKVAVIGYWVGQDAIDYAVTFSEKNRGFDPKSPVQLICYEVQLFNLEDKEFTFDSEMMLCDKSASRTGRTGTMYAFNYEDITVKAKGSVIFNDWATSTEIEQKYVAWGKSFNRQYDTVFFMILAGTGEVPEYSAYKEFTGQSVIEVPDNQTVVEDESTGTEDDSDVINDILDSEEDDEE